MDIYGIGLEELGEDPLDPLNPQSTPDQQSGANTPGGGTSRPVNPACSGKMLKPGKNKWTAYGTCTSDIVAALRRHGYNSIVDSQGALGAVKQFQRDKGLSVDGIVGKQTWAALLAAPFMTPPEAGYGQPAQPPAPPPPQAKGPLTQPSGVKPAPFAPPPPPPLVMGGVSFFEKYRTPLLIGGLVLVSGGLAVALGLFDAKKSPATATAVAGLGDLAGWRRRHRIRRPKPEFRGLRAWQR